MTSHELDAAACTACTAGTLGITAVCSSAMRQLTSAIGPATPFISNSPSKSAPRPSSETAWCLRARDQAAALASTRPAEAFEATLDARFRTLPLHT